MHTTAHVDCIYIYILHFFVRSNRIQLVFDIDVWRIWKCLLLDLYIKNKLYKLRSYLFWVSYVVLCPKSKKSITQSLLPILHQIKAQSKYPLGDFWWYGISVFGPFRQPGQCRKKGSGPIMSNFLGCFFQVFVVKNK